MTVELSPGATFAGFRVESLAGRGAMAEVYCARDPDGRLVALKVLGLLAAADERFRQRFLRESELAASLHHPNVVRTLAAGEDDGRLYLAMEFVDGSDLRNVLRREGRLEPERAVAIVVQAAAALDAAHAGGLVHRDVKPGNILLGPEEHVVVCDFGLARHVSSVSSLTGDRGFVGTIDYVPPEQIEGSPVDARADTYSLGCVLFECLTGARPFDRESELSVVFAHLNEPPPRVTDLHPELPAAFDDVIATALAKAPGDRYGSCGELAAAAQAALRGRVLGRRRSRRRLAIGAVAVAVAAGAAVAAVALTHPSHARAAPTISTSSIAGAHLGDSAVVLEALWGRGYRKLTMQTPSDYVLVTNPARHVSSYFTGSTDRTVEITTWNSADRTADGIGPCSSLADLRRVYGSRLKASPNNTHNGVVAAWTVGRHLLFAMGPGAHPTTVQTVAIYRNDRAAAAFNALNDGPCGPGSTFSDPPAAAKAAAAAQGPQLTAAFVSHAFEPRLRGRLPEGWHVQADTRRALTLRSTAGSSMTFRLDPRASAPGRAPLRNVSATVAGLTTWLRAQRALTVTPPLIELLSTPALTWSSFDVRPRGRVPAPLVYPGGAVEPPGTAHLSLASIRIDALVHTLAVSVRAPSNAAFARAKLGVHAILASLKVSAAAAPGLSALSSFCGGAYGGTCQGELAAGTHRTISFGPQVTYTVPVGWTNAFDQVGNLSLIPPGGDWRAIDSGRSDYVAVFTRVAGGRRGCADGHAAARTPESIARWLQRSPALDVTEPKPASVGGLSGLVVTIHMKAGWTKPCPWSRGVPAADGQVITGLDPSPSGMIHGVWPRPMAMRLYLLHYRRGTLAVEIDEVRGDAKLDAYSRVVKTFGFKR